MESIPSARNRAARLAPAGLCQGFAIRSSPQAGTPVAPFGFLPPPALRACALRLPLKGDRCANPRRMAPPSCAPAGTGALAFPTAPRFACLWKSWPWRRTGTPPAFPRGEGPWRRPAHASPAGTRAARPCGACQRLIEHRPAARRDGGHGRLWLASRRGRPRRGGETVDACVPAFPGSALRSRPGFQGARWRRA